MPRRKLEKAFKLHTVTCDVSEGARAICCLSDDACDPRESRAFPTREPQTRSPSEARWIQPAVCPPAVLSRVSPSRSPARRSNKADTQRQTFMSRVFSRSPSRGRVGWSVGMRASEGAIGRGERFQFGHDSVSPRTPGWTV